MPSGGQSTTPGHSLKSIKTVEFTIGLFAMSRTMTVETISPCGQTKRQRGTVEVFLSGCPAMAATGAEAATMAIAVSSSQ